VSVTQTNLIGTTTVVELYVPRLDPSTNNTRYFGGILIYVLPQGIKARRWINSNDAVNAHIVYLTANSRYVFGYQLSTDPPPAGEFPGCEVDEVARTFMLLQ
jgi:hypothetical protein